MGRQAKVHYLDIELKALLVKIQQNISYVFQTNSRGVFNMCMGVLAALSMCTIEVRREN